MPRSVASALKPFFPLLQPEMHRLDVIATNHIRKLLQLCLVLLKKLLYLVFRKFECHQTRRRKWDLIHHTVWQARISLDRSWFGTRMSGSQAGDASSSRPIFLPPSAGPRMRPYP